MATATFNTAFTSEAAESGDVGDIPAYARVYDDSSQTNEIARFDLSSTHTGLTLSQTINFAANALVFTLAEGSNSSDDITAFGLVEALRGIFRADRYISFFTGTGNNTRSTASRRPCLT